MSKTHEAIMVKEILEYLILNKNGTYVDCTFGAGGHSEAIIQTLNPKGVLIGFDRDKNTADHMPYNLKSDSRFTLINDAFSNMNKYLQGNELDGILIDLGISSTQLDSPIRGFSFQKEGPLDMRMSTQDDLSAADWINNASKKEIEDVLWNLGEERASRKIAKLICEHRVKEQIETTQDLVKLIVSCVPRRGNKHPATNTFRAIRMVVNKELEELRSVLDNAGSLLKSGGRVAVISFHSIEDRIVKRFIQGKDRISSKVELRVVGNKFIKPDLDEIKANPRSRSAILRVAEKVA